MSARSGFAFACQHFSMSARQRESIRHSRESGNPLRSVRSSFSSESGRPDHLRFVVGHCLCDSLLASHCQRPFAFPGIEWVKTYGVAEGRATSNYPSKTAILPILILLCLLVGCE